MLLKTKNYKVIRSFVWNSLHLTPVPGISHCAIFTVIYTELMFSAFDCLMLSSRKNE
jgi:hypothetical protein